MTSDEKKENKRRNANLLSIMRESLGGGEVYSKNKDEKMVGKINIVGNEFRWLVFCKQCAVEQGGKEMN